MAKQQRKRTRPSWFKKQADKYGTVDFLLKKPADSIRRESMNIVRDIVRDNITPNDFRYLFDQKVLSNVRLGVEDKFNETQIYFASMQAAINSQEGQMTLYNFGISSDIFQKVFNDTQNMCNALGTVLYAINTLSEFVASPGQKAEEDYNEIYSNIQYRLRPFKYIL